MDIAAFKAQIDAARGFECTAGGITFRLRLPTQHAWRLAIEQNVTADGVVLRARAMRAVLDAALVGWDGVTPATIMSGADAAPLPFSAEARALLLEHRQDIADELSTQVGIELLRRRDSLEETRKN